MQSYLQSEMFLSNSVDMMKNLPRSNLQSLVDFKNSETSKSHNGFQTKDTGQVTLLYSQASVGKKF